MKTRLLDNIQQFLESKGGLKKSWIRTFIVLFLSLIIASIVLGIGIDYGVDGPKFDSNISLCVNLTQNKDLYIIAKDLCISIFVIGIFPIICLFSSWIIGINQTSKSKYFHLFMWFFVFVALVLSITTLIIFIRCCVFNNDVYFQQ